MAWLFNLLACGLPLGTMWIFPSGNAKRLLLSLITVVFGLRYAQWRLSTFPWHHDLISWEWLWWLIVLIIEVAVLIEVFLFLCTVSFLPSRRQDVAIAECRLRSRWLKYGSTGIPSVDIFITTYNEHLDVLEKAILGALGVDYPCFNVWVLDDGKRAWLEDYCHQTGVAYISRDNNRGAKAGNINNALQHSTADLVLVLDADSVCYRYAIWKIAGLFDDQTVATIQTPQMFYNSDAMQHNLRIASCWSDEQSYFFRLIARGRDALGVAFCCGSCSFHRRSMLQAVGGFPTESITEDILLTIALCARGWRTIYCEVPISIGLAAESLHAYFIQRKRWGRGGIQVAWLMLFRPNLNFIKRIFFFPYSWITQYISRLFFQLIPILFFVGGLTPIPNVDIDTLLSYQTPFLACLLVSMFAMGEGYYLPLFSEAINLFHSFELAPAIFAAVLRPFGQPFAVTPKGHSSISLISGVYLRTLVPALILLVLNVLILFQMLLSVGETVSQGSVGLLVYGFIWCCMNIALLYIAILASDQRPQPRREHRMSIGRPCTLVDRCGVSCSAHLVNVSTSGALCRLPALVEGSVSDYLSLVLEDDTIVPIHLLMRRSSSLLALAFSELSLSTKQAIVGYAFSGSFSSAEQPVKNNPFQTLCATLANLSGLR